MTDFQPANSADLPDLLTHLTARVLVDEQRVLDGYNDWHVTEVDIFDDLDEPTTEYDWGYVEGETQWYSSAPYGDPADEVMEWVASATPPPEATPFIVLAPEPGFSTTWGAGGAVLSVEDNIRILTVAWLRKDDGTDWDSTDIPFILPEFHLPSSTVSWPFVGAGHNTVTDVRWPTVGWIDPNGSVRPVIAGPPAPDDDASLHFQIVWRVGHPYDP